MPSRMIEAPNRLNEAIFKGFMGIFVSAPHTNIWPKMTLNALNLGPYSEKFRHFENIDLSRKNPR